jgi:hypothetical protein
MSRHQLHHRYVSIQPRLYTCERLSSQKYIKACYETTNREAGILGRILTAANFTIQYIFPARVTLELGQNFKQNLVMKCMHRSAHPGRG